MKPHVNCNGILKIIIIIQITVLISCCSRDTGTERPNFLVIFVDDLRPQLGCYGHQQMISPNIDRLANEGIMFERAFCQVPVCGASRASLLTGMRPTRSRFLNYQTRADEDLPGHLSLPRYLKESGYYTLSYGKVYHHNDDDSAGWSEYPWRPSGKNWRNYITEENLDIAANSDIGSAYPYEIAESADYNDYFDGMILDTAVSRLQDLKNMNQPFFLAVGFLKPHLPFNAPEKFWDLYTPDSLELASNPYKPQNAPDEAMHNWGELRQYYGIPQSGQVSKEMEIKLVHGYYACVSYTDAMVGKLLEELNELDLSENTVVILFGDHGWNLGEHGLWCKHCNFYNALRVPLIVKVPGMTNGNKIESLTELIDIYPTVCEIAGLTIPEHLQGKSFYSVIKDPRLEHKKESFSRYIRGETIITERYNYTEWINDDSLTHRARMLYDHQSDPEENVNVAEDKEYMDITEKLIVELRKLTEMGRVSSQTK